MGPPRRRHTVLDDAEEYEAFDASAPSILPETKPSPATYLIFCGALSKKELLPPYGRKASNDARLLRGRSSVAQLERAVRICLVSQ